MFSPSGCSLLFATQSRKSGAGGSCRDWQRRRIPVLLLWDAVGYHGTVIAIQEHRFHTFFALLIRSPKQLSRIEEAAREYAKTNPLREQFVPGTKNISS